MAMQNFEICFCSEILQVKSIINNIMSFLLESLPDLTEEDAFDLRLIYSELLYNAVIHGNKLDMGKSVRLSVEVANNTVYSMISDEGLGFDYIKLLSNINRNDDVFGETGRGICLVRSLTDSLAFNVTGNQITFYKKVNRNGKNFNC